MRGSQDAKSLEVVIAILAITTAFISSSHVMTVFGRFRGQEAGRCVRSVPPNEAMLFIIFVEPSLSLKVHVLYM